MYTFINFSNQIIVRRGPLSLNKGSHLIHHQISGGPLSLSNGVSYTNLVFDLVMTFKIDSLVNP
jgi:hypothetical protein